MFAVLALVIMFIVVVGLHEAGHAVVAYWLGVKIKRISLGFGPVLYAKTDKKGIEWALSLWPLGGYVQLYNNRIKVENEAVQAYCFDKQSSAKRCLILLAGGVVNCLVAWFAIVLMLSVGYVQYRPVIDEVIPNSLAAQAGFRAGDRILAINGETIASWQQAGMKLITELGHPALKLELINDKKQSRMVALDLYNLNDGYHHGLFFKRIGFKAKLDDSTRQWVDAQPVYRAVPRAFSQIMSFLLYDFTVLKLLITGAIPFSMLLGPLGLFAISIHSFIQGFSTFMLFLALLSLAVGVVNYLPLPGLDGCSVFYLLLEKIRGKPLSVAMEILLYRLASIIFVIVLVQLLLNDLILP